jgi:hypothetical protein
VAGNLFLSLPNFFPRSCLDFWKFIPRNKGKESEPYSNGSFIFDALLYQSRTVIERANAWIDGFKALGVRLESRARNWKAVGNEREKGVANHIERFNNTLRKRCSRLALKHCLFQKN